MKYGAEMMMALFILTIATAVCFHHFLHLPPAAGMMLGLGFLGVFSHHINSRKDVSTDTIRSWGPAPTKASTLCACWEQGNSVAQVIEKIPIAAFLIDRDHKITVWNKGMEELTGIPASERIGTNLTWSPFYKNKRPALADLILDSMPDVQISRTYEGKHRISPLAKRSL